MFFYVLWEPIWTIWICRKNWRLLMAELFLRAVYLFPSPNLLARSYMRGQNHTRKGAGTAHSLLYGHTPTSTLDAIGSACGLSKDMVLYDVGCGAGYSLFYWRYRFGARVLGIELNPSFIKRILWCCGLLKEEYVHAQTVDARAVDYSPADVIYVHGTSFTTELMSALFQRWESELLLGTVVISVLHHPQDYGAKRLAAIGSIDGHFPWGVCPVYICQQG